MKKFVLVGYIGEVQLHALERGFQPTTDNFERFKHNHCPHPDQRVCRLGWMEEKPVNNRLRARVTVEVKEEGDK